MVGVDIINVNKDDYLCDEHKDVTSVEVRLLRKIASGVIETNKALDEQVYVLCGIHESSKAFVSLIAAIQNNPP